MCHIVCTICTIWQFKSTHLYLPFLMSTAYFIPSYYFHVSSFFSELLLPLVLLLKITVFLLPDFSPEHVLDILNCIIFDCLIYVPERDSRKWQLKLIQDLIHMFEAESFCPFGITHLLPICPAILDTIHRQVPVFMTALNFFIIYVYYPKFICRLGQCY